MKMTRKIKATQKKEGPKIKTAPKIEDYSKNEDNHQNEGSSKINIYVIILTLPYDIVYDPLEAKEWTRKCHNLFVYDIWYDMIYHITFNKDPKNKEYSKREEDQKLKRLHKLKTTPRMKAIPKLMTTPKMKAPQKWSWPHIIMKYDIWNNTWC